MFGLEKLMTALFGNMASAQPLQRPRDVVCRRFYIEPAINEMMYAEYVGPDRWRILFFNVQKVSGAENLYPVGQSSYLSTSVLFGMCEDVLEKHPHQLRGMRGDMLHFVAAKPYLEKTAQFFGAYGGMQPK
jgi:hypothetical protein